MEGKEEAKKETKKGPVAGDESLMSQKKNGTADKPPMKPLRWACDWETANRICCFNRHYAEHSGYFRTTKWPKEVAQDKPTIYYDCISGKPLFKAPVGRSFKDFYNESIAHGWPSFRDEEVIWDDVRVLKNGETVSTCGNHLGHNLPDKNGNRYCINLVSIAGTPPTE
mmetsp:Transcript_27797/g.49078  ORF Transcript_27797/g.49078 Transcript_27797/m.49078 type:complete len:168 (+) Transcript_27797:98-601(+)|eukprot:CAMPEP_0197520872 /NCGR_PEP_ID=MMETSP1318-20131121/6198_1 /TAXON_ID=552666 /ORGANISM="Partenskyella glossopodia, Strain RCC365" /LENGTH=167 /DNA_ID=CAMNT_0043072629 /DNA_START=87 /DNA_END=590 /DNA_ORIENTATION=+